MQIRFMQEHTVEYQKGALEPPATSEDTALDYRFVIQNDQKWIYASNVFDGK